MTPNCTTNPESGAGTNGVEMSEIPAKSEEMTELTEHLRRQTQKQYRTSVRRSPPRPSSPAARYLARQKQTERYAKIDRFFLVAFPLLFLTFNVVYWVAYYFAHPVVDLDAE